MNVPNFGSLRATQPKLDAEKGIRARLNLEAEEQKWPEGVPVTAENIQEVSRTHDVVYSESIYSPTIDPDEYDWAPRLGVNRRQSKSGYRGRYNESDAYIVSRDLSTWHPYCRRAITLYEMYIFGPDYYMSLSPKEPPSTLEDLKRHYTLMLLAEQVWEDTLTANAGAFSLQELVRRLYRDGEVFVEVIRSGWPWALRFIDKEEIGDSAGAEGDQGIITAENDINNILAYRVITVDTKEEVRRISAANMVHIAIDKDSNEKRGRPRMLSSFEIARMLEGFTMTEATHRQMQASIVIRRRVDGGAAVAERVLNNSRTGTTASGTSYERWGKGTILTEPKGLTTEFVQPKSDFNDASPLARFLLTHIAAATGWSYSMLSQDTSQGNLASEELAEGPVQQMLRYERSLIRPVLEQLFKDLISEAARLNMMTKAYRGPNIWNDYKPYFNFGSELDRNALQNAQARNMAYMGNGMSAQDICEAGGRNWIKTLIRIFSERELGIFPASYQMPSNQDRANSSKDNATQGSGTNQGQSNAN